uniref:Putative reverse transcriptase, RNA-dependent DNA polymerase n=1 Tax=Tanacetum cinerariifolium TaxID=118510 RepID=A0A6L2M530_TANCI|nr:putative reverse transcriptase, RNA-dependent DNA polymerase [Tanacetum cinerariifolium]
MKCPEDIKTYAKIRFDKKLFQFLNGLDRKFEPITREILRVSPLPTAEVAYATVHKEAAHQNILGASNNEPQGIATGLITRETEGVDFVKRDTAGMTTRRNGTGRIIGRGTHTHREREREGLYYVDEVTTSGTVMLAHGTSEREAWLWHRRLRHLFNSYSHNGGEYMNSQINLFFQSKGIVHQTTSHGVLLKTNGYLNIQIFTDADWAGDKGNRISTSGYFYLVGGNMVTWKSKKKKFVSLSNSEAKFKGIAKGLVEALWIRKLVSEIGFPPKESIRIMSDNKANI